MQDPAGLGPAPAHEVRPLGGVEELAVEADATDLLVGHGLDHHDVGGRPQPPQVHPGQLALLTGPHLARHRQDAGRPVLPTGRVLTGEFGRVEAVDRERGVAGLLHLEDGAHREDVDQATVAPVLAVERHGGHEEREGDGHADGTRHAQVRVRLRPDVVEPVLLHAPHRGVRRDLELPQRHVSQQATVRRLDPLAPDDAGEAAPRRRDQRGQTTPVDVDVVLGLEAEHEFGHLLGGDAGGHGEPEQSRSRAQRDHRRPHPGLLERPCHSDDRGERTAPARRHQREAPPLQPVHPKGPRGREGSELHRSRPLAREPESGPSHVREQPGIVADAVGPLPGGGDHVEVLAEPEHVEGGAQHATTALSGCAVAMTSAKPSARHSTSSSWSGTAVVSTVRPMQHVPA